MLAYPENHVREWAALFGRSRMGLEETSANGELAGTANPLANMFEAAVWKIMSHPEYEWIMKQAGGNGIVGGPRHQGDLHGH